MYYAIDSSEGMCKLLRQQTNQPTAGVAPVYSSSSSPVPLPLLSISIFFLTSVSNTQTTAQVHRIAIVPVRWSDAPYSLLVRHVHTLHVPFLEFPPPPPVEIHVFRSFDKSGAIVWLATALAGAPGFRKIKFRNMNS